MVPIIGFDDWNHFYLDCFQRQLVNSVSCK